MSGVAELEHAIGFNGGVPGALLVLPPHAAVFGMSPPTAAEAPPARGGGAPGSVRVVSAAGSCAIVGDLMDHHAQVFLRGHAGALSAVALSPSARLLATGERGLDADVCVWDLASGAVLHRFQEHDHGIVALGFSDDERLLVSVGAEQDGLLLVWDLSTGAQVTRLRHEPAPVLCLAWGGFVKDIKGRDTALYQFATGARRARARASGAPVYAPLSLNARRFFPPTHPPLPAQAASRACRCGRSTRSLASAPASA